MDNATLHLLRTRRSVKPHMLAAPGPTSEEIETILAVATRVPDHKKLAPWRFILFEGEARARIGEVFAEACASEEREPPSALRLDAERQRFLRAPLVIAVVSRVVAATGAPEWEQILSSGAACMNTCLAANAMGYGTCWITEWIAYSPRVREALGLGENERIAGFLYIGTATERQPDRERPVVGDLVTRWSRNRTLARDINT